MIMKLVKIGYDMSCLSIANSLSLPLSCNNFHLNEIIEFPVVLRLMDVSAGASEQTLTDAQLLCHNISTLLSNSCHVCAMRHIIRQIKIQKPHDNVTIAHNQLKMNIKRVEMCVSVRVCAYLFVCLTLGECGVFFLFWSKLPTIHFPLFLWCGVILRRCYDITHTNNNFRMARHLNASTHTQSRRRLWRIVNAIDCRVLTRVLRRACKFLADSISLPIRLSLSLSVHFNRNWNAEWFRTEKKFNEISSF